MVFHWFNVWYAKLCHFLNNRQFHIIPSFVYFQAQKHRLPDLDEVDDNATLVNGRSTPKRHRRHQSEDDSVHIIGSDEDGQPGTPGNTPRHRKTTKRMTTNRFLGEISSTVSTLAKGISNPEGAMEKTDDEEHRNFLWCRWLAGKLNTLSVPRADRLKHKISGLLLDVQEEEARAKASQQIAPTPAPDEPEERNADGDDNETSRE